MFIIISLFIFGGIAIVISEKNKFSPEEAVTIFLCSLISATVLPITLVKDKTNNDNTKTKKALDAILDKQ